jgi:hypothetical protein
LNRDRVFAADPDVSDANFARFSLGHVLVLTLPEQKDSGESVTIT